MTIYSQRRASYVANYLIEKSCKFSIEPDPYDYYYITTREDALLILYEASEAAWREHPMTEKELDSIPHEDECEINLVEESGIAEEGECNCHRKALEDKAVKHARLRLPCDLDTRDCWIGAYGGHFDIVVVFHTEPRKNDRGYYDTHDNKDLIAGVFDRADFATWFRVDIDPSDTEITRIEKYRLTAAWVDKKILGLNTKAD